jgi:hypothetical protein
MVVQDKYTNQLTIVSVIESLEHLTAHELSEQSGTPHLSARWDIVGVWRRSPEDSDDQEFEQRFHLYLPPSDSRVILAKGKFKFQAGKQLNRSVLQMVGWPPINHSGVLRIEDMVRKLGDREWKTQEYRIVVEVPSTDFAPTSVRSENA